MCTGAAPLGWGWTIRAVVGLIGLALAITSNTPRLRAQAGTVGEWKTLGVMPINPVHAALMNNGKVLIVSGSGNVAAETNFKSAVLDPLTGALVQTYYSQSWDMFCNGMVVLSDGRVFVNGGNLKYDPFWGQPKNAVFDPATSLFTDAQNMAHGRWYPTVTTLGDGRVMTFSGLDENGNTNTTVEIYSPSSGWSQPYSAGWTPPLYPRMHLLPDGRVIYTGSTAQTRVFNPSSPSTTWPTVVANTNFTGTRNYGTSVLLPLRPSDGYKGRVMIMGGGNPSTATTEILDTSVPQLQWQWVTKAPMTQPRIQMNATILPNGKILATGGSYRDEDTTTASLNADLYDPVSNTFSSAGQNAYPRVYHSNALLLPDATVLLLGGNPQRGTYEQRMEIYSPAYLFNGDGTLAASPAITSVTPALSRTTARSKSRRRTPPNIAPGRARPSRNADPRVRHGPAPRRVDVHNRRRRAHRHGTSEWQHRAAWLLHVLHRELGGCSVCSTVRSYRDVGPNQAPTASIDTPSNVTITAAMSSRSPEVAAILTDHRLICVDVPWRLAGVEHCGGPGNVTYATPGSYTATFKVTDNGGLSSSTKTRTITVSSPPNLAPSRRSIARRQT